MQLENERIATWPAFLQIAAQATGVLIFGMAAALLAGQTSSDGDGLRLAAIGAMVVLALAVAAITHQFRRTMLCGWIVSHSYFRTFSPWTGAPVALTSFDSYVTVSDLFFAVLIGIAIWQRVYLKLQVSPPKARLWIWVLPFLIVAAISIVNAARVDWAVFEVYRLAKLVLELALLAALIREPYDWWLALGAMGAGACFQGLFGVVQLATGSGIVLVGESLQRATATLGHPNTLSSFLGLIWPPFGVLALIPGNPWRRWLGAAAALSILAGIAVAQSRAVWLIAAGQVGLIFLGVIWLRMVPLKRALGLGIVLVTAVLFALIPFASRIQARITDNWDESAEFRTRYNAVALEMYSERPWIGGGPRQFPLRFGAHAYEMYGRAAGIVPAYPVHNFYLLELTEYGAFGALALALFLGAVLFRGFRGIGKLPPVSRAAALGLGVGMVGILIHQLSELVLVLDPNLYCFGLVGFLMASAPAAGAPGRPMAVAWQIECATMPPGTHRE